MGLLSCVSPTLDEASRSRLQCHSIFILVSCHRGHGPLGAQGVVTRRLLLLQHDILAECAQTIYFGSDWLSTGCWTRIISFTGWVWSAVIHPRNINNATVKACFTRKAVYGVVWYDRCVGTPAHYEQYEHICTKLLILAAAARCPELCWDQATLQTISLSFTQGKL